jgi:neutral ceramidase
MLSWFRAVILAGVVFVPGAAPQQTATLLAGAAKVDITPPADAAVPMSGYASRTEGFKGIHDRIYARAIVVSDGVRNAAIVSWELIGVPNALWEQLSQRIARETGIQPEYLQLTAVHNHSAPTPFGIYGHTSPQSAAYTTQLADATVEVVKLAKANLQPARMGIGSSMAHVNINRREYSSERGWALGFNPAGPSDKTVTVLRFDALSGKPIALFINYPVHVVVMGPENYQISGDLAGATSRYVENYYRRKPEETPRSDAGPAIRLAPEAATDGVVALWTSGAAGDQNPISLARGSDFTMVDALGKMLGEQAVRAAAAVQPTTAARVWGKQQLVSCPGRRLEPGPRPRKWADADPVDIRLALLTINDVALAGVSGEVMTMIHQRLAKSSPLSRTIMITHANGASGYIPDDAAYEQVSYEIESSRLKPGCAEDAIVSGFVSLIGERR